MAFVIQGSSTGTPTAGLTTYNAIFAMEDSAWNSTENISRSWFLGSAVIKNLTVELITAPGAGQSRVFTIYKNGVSTGLTVTIADAATSANIATVAISVASGDYINIACVSSAAPSAPTRISFAVLCETVDNYYMMFGGRNEALLTDATREYAWPGGAKAASTWSTTLDTARKFYFSHTVTSTSLFVSLPTGSPGTGNSYTFALVKNGTLQDGAGGTVDTTTVISDSNTSATKTFSLSLTDGDEISITYTSASVPNSRIAEWAIKFVPAVEGESTMSGTCTSASTSATTWYRHLWWGRAGSTASEGNSIIPFPVGLSYYVYNLRSLVSVAPGAAASGKKRTQTWRKNGSSNEVSIEILETATTGSSSTIVKYAAGETISVQTAPTATPAASNVVTYATLFIMPEKSPITLT